MTITINNKDYKIKKFDFGALVKLEECGIGLNDLTNMRNMKKPFTLIVGLIAWIIDGDKEEATKELNEHISNGGKLEDILKVVEVIKDDDFFQKAMQK